MRARPFAPSEAEAAAWDAFCERAHNATFLHSRRFLSYHGDRFVDASLVLEDDDGQWLGLLPAAWARDREGWVVSHPGSSYGGLLHAGRLRGDAALQALQAAASAWREQGATRLRYKVLPHIYQLAPAQDDVYALFRLGAQLTRCDLSCCIDLAQPLPRSQRRRRALARARQAGLSLAQGAELLPALWPVLSANLAERHGVQPVHTLAEITELAARFPQAIAVHAAWRDGQLLAGTVLFCTPRVVHAQYLASSPEGREVGALDAVLDAAIAAAAQGGLRHFDFGISTEDEGRRLNAGLYAFKSEFGGGGVVHEFYDLDLVSATPPHPTAEAPLPPAHGA